MGFSWQHILVVIVVIVLLFGAKKLPQLGKGMGEAIKNFKKSVGDKSVEDITPTSAKDGDKVENKNS